MHVLFKKTLCYVVIEALDPFFMAITSILFIYKVFHNLHMLWMYIGMCSYHVTTSLINQAHIGFYWESWTMLGNKPQHYAVVEALDSFKKAHISISNIFKVFDNLCAVKVSIDATLPCSVSLIGQAFWMLLQTPGNPGQQTTALCGGWGTGLIQKSPHINSKHM